MLAKSILDVMLMFVVLQLIIEPMTSRIKPEELLVDKDKSDKITAISVEHNQFETDGKEVRSPIINGEWNQTVDNVTEQQLHVDNKLGQDIRAASGDDQYQSVLTEETCDQSTVNDDDEYHEDDVHFFSEAETDISHTEAGDPYFISLMYV